jgi:hypothetical protein
MFIYHPRHPFLTRCCRRVAGDAQRAGPDQPDPPRSRSMLDITMQSLRRGFACGRPANLLEPGAN